LWRFLGRQPAGADFYPVRARGAAGPARFPAGQFGDLLPGAPRVRSLQDESLRDYAAAAGLAAWRVVRHRRADAPRVFRRRVAERHVIALPAGAADALARAREALPTDAHAELDWAASVSLDRALAVSRAHSSSGRELEA